MNINNKNHKSILLRYAIPAILSMWIFALYSTVDGIFVGRGVSEEALGAVTLSMPFINLSFAFSIMTSIGSSVSISNLLGRGKLKEAREQFTLTIVFLSIFGVLLCFFSRLFLEDIALLLGATETSLPLVKEYLGTILIFNTFYLVAYALEILIKVEGKPKVAVLVVSIAGVTNIILDYLLVIAFPLGLKGAAIATGTSQLIQGIILISFFMRKKSKLKFVTIKPSIKRIISIIRIGIPDSITELSIGLFILIFNRVLLSHFGDIGVIAFSIISYIYNFIILTMVGLTQGMQPLVSYLSGMNEVKIRRKLLNFTLVCSLVFGLFSFIGLNILGKIIVKTFVYNSSTIDFTLSSLRYFSPVFLILGLNIVISGYLTSIKKTLYASLVSSLRGFLLIPLSILVTTFILGDKGVWLSVFVSEFLTLTIILVRFLSYKKKGMIISINQISG